MVESVLLSPLRELEKEEDRLGCKGLDGCRNLGRIWDILLDTGEYLRMSCICWGRSNLISPVAIGSIATQRQPTEVV